MIDPKVPNSSDSIPIQLSAEFYSELLLKVALSCFLGMVHSCIMCVCVCVWGRREGNRGEGGK